MYSIHSISSKLSHDVSMSCPRNGSGYPPRTPILRLSILDPAQLRPISTKLAQDGIRPTRDKYVRGPASSDRFNPAGLLMFSVAPFWLLQLPHHPLPQITFGLPWGNIGTIGKFQSELDALISVLMNRVY